MPYPEFIVSGVPESEVWQLFNVSNYEYYKQKVADLIVGKCPFCDIDPAVNKVLFENDSWRMWENKLAPRSGQQHQFIIPSKRHVQRVSELTTEDWVDLADIIGTVENFFGVYDGVLGGSSQERKKRPPPARQLPSSNWC